MYDHHFSSFGRSPVPDNLCKDSDPIHHLFWRRRFLKVLNIYGHGDHLGQWTATILANFQVPVPRRLHIKFEQHWPRGFRGEVVWNSQHFSHTNVWCQYKCIRKQTWPRRKKGQTSMYNHYSSNFVQRFSPKVSSVLERKIFKDFTIYGHGGHLVQRTATILAIFRSYN